VVAAVAACSTDWREERDHGVEESKTVRCGGDGGHYVRARGCGVVAGGFFG
jgi:hypothetical protein